MAGCYHDEQDFKSDLNIEVAREGDILEAGQDLDKIECTKNPGHRDFIPFKDLALEHLPNEIRSREMLDKINMMGSCVVRLVVNKIRNGRRKKDAGSGCVMKINNEYIIKTNNHVVKTEDDMNNCTIEFHYDDASKSNVLLSRVVKRLGTCNFRDVTTFTFHPVPDFLHQLDWTYDKQPTIVVMYKNNEIKTELATVRLLRFVSELDLNSSLIKLIFIYWPDGSFSYIKSFCFKFQPIPFNIQELTSIEIYIDEDDGNSRVIPGDVVKLGDEFVVEISESIFQDEVKKCRLVWNGDVIGRGTRLHFEPVKSSDIRSGIDLEVSRENYWRFDCYPIPKDVDDMLLTFHHDYLCCIGHPHGGIKMVTFGRWLTIALEKFDHKYRRIAQPNPDCQCKDVGLVKYSCKTCEGSSGSPVFSLHGNLAVSFTHFMGKKVEELYEGEPIENINIAWIPTPPS